MATFTGVTPLIGGTEIFGGSAFTTTAAVVGATVGMTVIVTPRTFPGNGIYWEGFVSAPDVVTVKVGAAITLYVTASIYDVMVIDSSTPPLTQVLNVGTLLGSGSGTASGTVVWHTVYPAAAGSNASATNIGIPFPSRFTITKVILQSDSGPGGIGNASTATLDLLSNLFVAGTPYVQAAFTVLDTAITLTVTGTGFGNMTITSFTAGSSITVPANTGLAWRLTLGGGTPSTNSVVFNMQIFGFFS